MSPMKEKTAYLRFVLDEREHHWRRYRGTCRLPWTAVVWGQASTPSSCDDGRGCHVDLQLTGIDRCWTRQRRSFDTETEPRSRLSTAHNPSVRHLTVFTFVCLPVYLSVQSSLQQCVSAEKCIPLVCEKLTIFPYGQNTAGNVDLLAFWWYSQVQDRCGVLGEMYKNVTLTSRKIDLP